MYKHGHVRIFGYSNQAMLVTREIKSPLLAITHLLEDIL